MTASLHRDAPAGEHGDGVPRQIGPYRLREVLGEGGMGVVYAAEQREPIRRTVALKLVKLGMDTRQVLARFESERQVLARMSHRNVAQVLDAGATDAGRPYFVMERVRGIPVTDYCDQYRVSTSDRLTMFVDICKGVQHAHEKGVIHRDIKPSNLLVALEGDQPIPKVIDFGVAKAVDATETARTVYTEYGQMIGTPEYMSPEQAGLSGMDIDKRTDVYSLGVVLYELLVGSLPFEPKAFRDKGYGEIQRIICEQEPPRPSTRLSSLGARSTDIAQARRTDAGTLQRQLRGELDWIIMKALEKDRTRRYESPAALAADVTRYLRGDAVLARPPSAIYRARKFARRHRAGVALVVAATLLAFAALATWSFYGQWRQGRFESLVAKGNLEAHRDPRLALQNFDRALALEPQHYDAMLPRARLLRRLNRMDEAKAAAESIVRVYPERAAPALVVLAQLAADYEPEESERLLEEARRLDPESRLTAALLLPNNPEGNEEAVRELRAVKKEDRLSFEAQWALAWRLYALGDYEQMREQATEMVHRWPDSATCHNALGIALSRLGDFDGAIKAYDTFIRQNADYAPIYLNRAEVRQYNDDLAGAIADCSTAIEKEPDRAAAWGLRAHCRERLARQSQGEKARKLTQEARRDAEEAAGLEDPTGYGHLALARLAAPAGKIREARNACDKGLERRSGGPIDWQYCGIVYRVEGDPARALELHDKLVAFNDSDQTSPTAERMELRARYHLVRSMTHVALGNVDAALADLAVAETFPDHRFQALMCQAEVLRIAGRDAAARTTLEKLQKDREALAAGSDARKLYDCALAALRSEGDLDEACSKDMLEPCDRVYFDGLRAIRRDDLNEARRLFQECECICPPGVELTELARMQTRRLQAAAP